MYNEKSFVYINDNKISNTHLFDDQLHLTESGKYIIANIIIDHLNYFLRTQLHFSNLRTHTRARTHTHTHTHTQTHTR